jgi:hypothetical protein
MRGKNQLFPQSSGRTYSVAVGMQLACQGKDYSPFVREILKNVTIFDSTLQI